tara:strand:- start:192 stop:392 length:201 start_codon:yes stop_codon:yes gene_type:complete
MEVEVVVVEVFSPQKEKLGDDFAGSYIGNANEINDIKSRICRENGFEKYQEHLCTIRMKHTKMILS